MVNRILALLIRFFINAVGDRFGPDARRARLAARAAGLADAAEGGVDIGEAIPSALDALRRKRERATGPERIVWTLKEKLRHLYILARTGQGKTELLTLLFLADVVAGFGAIILCYRGDFTDKILLRLAAKFKDASALAERLVLLDWREFAPYMGEQEPIVGFNPFAEAGNDPYTRAFYLLDILRQQWGEALGVQIAETLRNTLLALCLAFDGTAAGVHYTLLHIEPFLTVPEFRNEVLRKVKDVGVLRFFERFDAQTPAVRAQWVGAVLNKLSVWISRPRLRLGFGQGTSSISLRRLFEERPDAIVIVCLAGDELFRDTAGLLGNLVITAVARALMRSDRPVYSRRQVTCLFLDEFENVSGASTETLSEIISEGRKFGLCCAISHQTTVQLEPKLRGLIRNVVGTQIAFAVGGSDAEILAGEWPSDEPRAAVRNRLVSQDVGEAMLFRQGMRLTRAKIRYVPDPVVPAAKIAALRRASLERWGRPRREVEQAIADIERLYQTGEKTGTDAAGGGLPETVGAPPSDADQSIPGVEIREIEGGEEPPARKRRTRKSDAKSDAKKG